MAPPPMIDKKAEPRGITTGCYGQSRRYYSTAEPLAVASGCYGQLAKKQHEFNSFLQMRY